MEDLRANIIKDFMGKANVNELKGKLRRLGLSTCGLKAALIIRLEEAWKSLDYEEVKQHIEAVPDEGDLHTHVADNSGKSHVPSNYNVERLELDEIDNELELLREILKKKKEIALLKVELMKLSEESDTVSSVTRPSYSSACFKDIEDSIPHFSGDNNFPIEKWISQFEDSSIILNWDPNMKFLYARRMLTGTAKLFARSLSATTWNELKLALIKEFEKTVSNADIHDELRKRYMKREENTQQYLIRMQEIASSGDINETDLIQYIIKGIKDSEMNKILLYSAYNIEDLKLKLRQYDKLKSNSSRFVPKTNEYHQINLRCYNCNEIGHTSKRCVKPRRNQPCYKCGKSDHKGYECNLFKMADNTEDRKNNVLHLLHTNQFVDKNNFEYDLQYTFSRNEAKCDLSLKTLLDSGSPISFIQENFVPGFFVTTTDEKHNFVGINNSLLNIIGCINTDIRFKNSIKTLKLFVVENNTMYYPVILGRNFMELNNLELKEKHNMIEKNLKYAEKMGKNCTDETAQKEHLYLNSGMLNNTDSENNMFDEILNINYENNSNIDLNINKNLPFDVIERVENIIKPACSIVNENKVSNVSVVPEMKIALTKDNFLSPLVKDQLDMLKNKRYFSRLDLKNGILFVKISKRPMKYTSFVTPLRQLEYFSMPFGFKNVPVLFERFIKRLFKPLRLKVKLRDKFMEYPKNVSGDHQVDFLVTKKQAGEKIIQNQNYNKMYYDKLHKRPRAYKKGEYVKNYVSFPGIDKKLFSKYKEPYEVVEILPNDRYIIKDIEGMQLSRIPYQGVCSPVNMRPFAINAEQENSDTNVQTN